MACLKDDFVACDVTIFPHNLSLGFKLLLLWRLLFLKKALWSKLELMICFFVILNLGVNLIDISLELSDMLLIFLRG